MEKKAFTLAEIIIVVGVIGIVASFLIPAMIKENFKKEMREKLTVAISIINQANLKLRQDEGGAGVNAKYADYSTGAYPSCEFATNFVANINYVKILSAPTFPLGYAKSYSETQYNVAKGNVGTCLGVSNPVVVLKNGMLMNFSICWYLPMITIDLNGEKKPNRFGYDVFKFYIDSNDQIKPFFYNDAGSDRFRCEKNGSGTDNGFNCTKWAIEDKCPDGSNKGYWECLP